MRDEATLMLITDETMLLIGSPPCTMFSILQNGNRWRYSDEQWDAMLKKAQVHIEFCVRLFERQRRAGRYDLYEHPRTASSWKLPTVRSIMCQADCIEINANMCRFGMITVYKGETGLVSKATKFLTNSTEIAKRLDKKCDEHCNTKKHLAIWGSRAKLAQQYIIDICKAVTTGLKMHKLDD